MTERDEYKDLAFEDFVLGKDYDQFHRQLLRLTNEAFEAGWRAALSAPSAPGKLYLLNAQSPSGEEHK
ncbi:MAG: hypothetical protein ACOX81_04230 [Candidatus Heteroscillospira sp.]